MEDSNFKTLLSHMLQETPTVFLGVGYIKSEDHFYSFSSLLDSKIAKTENLFKKNVESLAKDLYGSPLNSLINSNLYWHDHKGDSSGIISKLEDHHVVYSALYENNTYNPSRYSNFALPQINFIFDTIKYEKKNEKNKTLFNFYSTSYLILNRSKFSEEEIYPYIIFFFPNGVEISVKNGDSTKDLTKKLNPQKANVFNKQRKSFFFKISEESFVESTYEEVIEGLSIQDTCFHNYSHGSDS